MESQNKGKPMTTSVPSISIKFHANAEHLEELYASDEEHTANDSSVSSSGAPGINETESSPLKYLPRLVKRSTSIDITPGTSIDASPPSDPWRFFSDIKGKITKSVEEKITEIKARNQEEGSPLKNKTVKDSKDNSSLSDSEDLSESSISKTCGIVSTTEGAEMSSDDDTPSIEKDKKIERSSGLRQRFRLLKPNSASREGTINRKSLASLYNINADKIEQALPEENEIESAVDALEDITNLQNVDDKILKEVEEQFDNIEIDKDNVINLKEVSGNEVKQLNWCSRSPKTIYAPVGFVDFRESPPSIKRSVFLPCFVISSFIIAYLMIHSYSSFLAGFMVGIGMTLTYYYLRNLLDTPMTAVAYNSTPQDILKVPAVREFQPLTKYEGWLNEFPDVYNPHTYHISQTQSVFLRLQGNLLRLSHSRSKVPKRALWNESKIKPAFTHHRVYNLLGARVTLLPEGLAKKRHWSKKYPICVTLNKDQMNFEPPVEPPPVKITEDEAPTTPGKPKRAGFQFTKKKKYAVLSQRFSKLTEENEEYDVDTDNSRGSTPSPDDAEDGKLIIDEDTDKIIDEALHDSLRTVESHEALFDEDFDTLPEDWGTFTPPDDDSPGQTKLYLFGRTDREKEDWFRRLMLATHRGADVPYSDSVSTLSDALVEKTMNEADYVKYMSIFNKIGKKTETSEETISVELQWINVFGGRILFDCFRDETFTQRIRNKIERKLASIKLPYFIESLMVTELSLGQTPPLIHKAAKPTLDERGLWIDLDVTYEGLIILILQTKLNLMKLKEPHLHDDNKIIDRPAMFNSDVEDSAESTSDEESMNVFSNAAALDSSGLPVQGLGGSSNTSKKFMKMVDRIAESKFFQAATDNRYIKKAMEGVSNTDLRLKVEVKELVGTLVLNVPPPPSDRVWIGFRPVPDLALSAQPIVGERNITYLRITSWIEKKLVQEFQKLMVIPNMEDFIVPVMSPLLPH